MNTVDKVVLVSKEKGLIREVSISRRNLNTVTVVVRGFVCMMTAEEFFKIIDEAHKW